MSISSQQQEKSSNFSQTCNLLSQYLKEKGSFGDLNLGMIHNLEGKSESFRKSTIPFNRTNLSPMMEMPPVEVSSRREIKSMDLFPQHTGFDSSPSLESFSKKIDFSIQLKESKNGQMTIFYAGKVLVFDNLTEQKAKEIMQFASKESSQNSFAGTFTSTSAKAIVSDTTTSFRNNSYQHVPNKFATSRIVSPNKDIHKPLISDLPIARKASLHRFLEKRKDRITSKAPYQVTSTSSSSGQAVNAPQTNHIDDKKTWLRLAASQSTQLSFQL